MRITIARVQDAELGELLRWTAYHDQGHCLVYGVEQASGLSMFLSAMMDADHRVELTMAVEGCPHIPPHSPCPALILDGQGNCTEMCECLAAYPQKGN